MKWSRIFTRNRLQIVTDRRFSWAPYTGKLIDDEVAIAAWEVLNESI